MFWIILGIVWTIAAACFLIAKPIIESKREISTVLAYLMIVIRSRVLFRNDKNVLLSPVNCSITSTIQSHATTNYKRILVAVDGSMPSIRALDYASHFSVGFHNLCVTHNRMA